jgi:hypothetical protein
MTFKCASGVTEVAIGCKHSLLRYWPHLGSKTIFTCSLSHSNNVPQWNVHDFLPGILANISVALRQLFIYDVLVAFSYETVHDICITPS